MQYDDSSPCNHELAAHRLQIAIRDAICHNDAHATKWLFSRDDSICGYVNTCTSLGLDYLWLQEALKSVIDLPVVQGSELCYNELYERPANETDTYSDQTGQTTKR